MKTGDGEFCASNSQCIRRDTFVARAALMPDLPPAFVARGSFPRGPWRTTTTARRERGLGPDWDWLRARILRDQPLCRLCEARGVLTRATEVDHIVPRAQGGNDERENLQPICHDCHVAKTLAEQLPREEP